MTFPKLIKQLRAKLKPKRVRAFRRVIPVKAFADDITFVTDRGAAGVCLEHGGIDDECLTDRSRENISERLMAAHKLFDDTDRLYQYAIRRANCPIVHKAVYENPKVQEINDDRHRHLRENAGFGSIEIYSVALREGNYKGKKATDQMVAERRKVCSTIAAKARSFARDTEDLFQTKVLEKDEAFLFLRKLLNLDESVSGSLRLKRDTGVDQQLAGTALTWDEIARHFRMGKRHVRVLSLKEAGLKNDCGLPARTVPNLLKDVLAVDCDMIICQQWHRAENPEVREEVKTHKKHITDFERHGAFAPESDDAKVDELMADESAEEAIKNLSSVLKQITNKGHYYGKFSYTVVLHGEDDSKLDAAIAKINKVFGAFDGALFEEDRGALAAYLAILPGNAKYGVREQWLGNNHFADLSLVYAPYTGKLTTSELADGEEYLGLYETRDGTPFYWDPFVGGAFGLFGTGMRGRGKTMNGNFIVSSVQKYNGFTCVLDLGGSYTENIKHFGGTIVSLRLGTRSFQIKPFDLEDNEDNHQFLFKFLQMLIERGGKELDPEQEKELFEQIRSMYALDPEDRTLSVFYENAPAYYKHELSKWIKGGQFGWCFDNVTDNVSLSRITCFEFEGVENYKELMEPLVMWILGRMRAKFFDPALVNVFKLINADEVWKYIQSPKVIAWLSEMLKTGRKHLVACALWTQSAEDLGEAKRLVIDNCETVAFLGNPNFDRELYRTSFGFNERELEIAAHLKAREFLLKTQERSKVLRLNVDPKAYWRYTTRPKERYQRQQALAEHGDQAINVLAASGGK